MAFLKNIARIYGPNVADSLRTTSKLFVKLAKQKNRRIFLLRCKHTDTTPVFLKFNVSHIEFAGTYLGKKFKNIINDTKQKILKLLITESTKNINEINNQINNNLNFASSVLPLDILKDFKTFENRKFEKIFNHIKYKNQKKFNKLLSLVPTDDAKINTTKWIHNMSNTQIPQDVAEILALGERFSVPITNERHLPVTDYIASIESVVQDKPNDEKESIRANIVNVITNHKLKLRHNKINYTKFQIKIQKQFTKAKQFVKENSQIKILKADKTSKTVIMNNTDYHTKINALLNDTNTYKKLKTDLTTSFQNKNNILVKKLLNKKTLTESAAKSLIIHNAIAPKIYGLPKLHKTDIPLRPIVSCIQSPFYKLSKYLSGCLRNITGKNDHYIKDSFEFKKFIDTIKIPDNYKLVSLDVVSLYTNIPNEIVSNIITQKWTLLQDHTTLTLQGFTEAVNLTLNNNYFQYENSFYQQLNGCAMGSPISSTIAQLVMEFLEESVTKALDFHVIFFKRFVDDCLTAVPECKIGELVTAFNNFHPKLQFTSETEINNQINFLDLTLIRESEQKIATKWYTKESWSGRYLNFNSNHPKKQINSVIIGLIDRAIALTSAKYRPEILQKVKQTLYNNQFPENTVSKIFKQRTFLFYNKDKKTNRNNNQQNNKKYIAMPYTAGLSEKISHILSKHNITVCHKAQNLVSSLFTPLKSKVPHKKKSNVVYSIPCLNCPKKYIGMTTQYLDNRLNGHKYTKNASTALHKHETQTRHEFDFNNTKILTQDRNYPKLVFKEMVEIKREKEAVNDKKDIDGLSQIYHNLIN